VTRRGATAVVRITVITLVAAALMHTRHGAVTHAQTPQTATNLAPEQAGVTLSAYTLQNATLPEGLDGTSILRGGDLSLAFNDGLEFASGAGAPPRLADLADAFAAQHILAFAQVDLADLRDDQGALREYALDSPDSAQALVAGGVPLDAAAAGYPARRDGQDVPSLGEGGRVFVPDGSNPTDHSIEAVWSRGSTAFDLALRVPHGDVSAAHAISLAGQFDALLAAQSPVAPLPAPAHQPPPPQARAAAFETNMTIDATIGALPGWTDVLEAPYDPTLLVMSAPDPQAELSWIDDQAQIIGGSVSSSGPVPNDSYRVLQRVILSTASAAAATAALCTEPTLPANWQPLQAPAVGNAACALLLTGTRDGYISTLAEVQWTRGSTLLALAVVGLESAPDVAAISALAATYDAAYISNTRSAP
jgi:hypothetical protein